MTFFVIKDLCISEPPSQMTLPGGHTGLRLPAPGRRIHHLGILAHMVIAQILQRFHHQTYAPAQAGAALIAW